MDGLQTQSFDPPLLRLPPHLRHKIYNHAGVIVDGRPPRQRSIRQPIQRWWSTDGHHDSSKRSLSVLLNGSSRLPPVTAALLFTCRKIYVEVCSIVYSTNEFYAHWQDRLGLQRLLALRSGAVSALQSLTLDLHNTSCGHDPCERAKRPFNLERFDDATLRQVPRQFKAPLAIAES